MKLEDLFFRESPVAETAIEILEVANGLRPIEDLDGKWYVNNGNYIVNSLFGERKQVK